MHVLQVTRIAINVTTHSYTLEYVASASSAFTDIVVPDVFLSNRTLIVTTTPPSVTYRTEYIPGRQINDMVAYGGKTRLLVSVPTDLAAQNVIVAVTVV
jgi:hypothetical protein